MFFSSLLRRARRAPGIDFLYNQPETPNLGDILCTPKNYFEFQSDRRVLVVGGGAFNGLGVRQARRVKADVRIAWGVGQSWRFGTAPRGLNPRKVGKTYGLATTRDPLFAHQRIPLLPCVSVLHPIVDLPIGNGHGLFLNRDDVASGAGVVDLLDRYSGDTDVVASNALPAAEFSEAFAQTGAITTNSYHAAYWALLSGRAVRLIGYSTKFVNLLHLFGLPADSLTPYERGDTATLHAAIEAAFSKPFVRSTDPDETKARFRDMNLAFADSLAKFGVRATPRPASS